MILDNLHIEFHQPKNLVFNRLLVRRAFMKIGQRHQEEARRRLMKRGGRSQAGETPRWQTGRLAQSIGYHVPRPASRRPGLMVKIAPNQKRGIGSQDIAGDFYPVFLHHGVRSASYGMPKQHKRQKRHHKSGGWRIEKRQNYMVATLMRLKSWTCYTLKKALRKSLRPERRRNHS
ncbi:hypothetical protein BJP41_06875 [Candidatus Williamhamiltonella defendens]|uniref:Phage virion morphogenesis protein n=1 Tax=Candidatus Williamhamiltonella defendens TaxID=138072 RepID=A0A2D3TA90_9ENTR|nr:hypothetical protein [Candidatus Hamiltonella defensa]ATW30092.1 hypothetical protein BJP41_06875 [Candidatus Hamiltonella defensa]ATW32716.1 hypothetical protein BJP42_07160 [Candidatus Hamiltonella defensa]